MLISSLFCSFPSTACNRTYYGKWGLTYELEIPRPKQRPFVCEMNFTAAGGMYGDIIQVKLTHKHTHINHCVLNDKITFKLFTEFTI